MSENIRENKLGTMPVSRLVISMSAPIVISMLVMALYNIVDSVFVSQISEDALTAVSLAFPLQNFLIAVAVGTGLGVNTLVSRSLGEKNYTMANTAACNGLLLAVISYAFFALIGGFFSEAFYRVQTDSEIIIEYGVSYLSICLVLSFGSFIEIMCERLLQATGRSMLSMVTQGIGAVINIVLDPILIFGWFGAPKMGISGAAVATTIAQIIAMSVALLLNCKCNKDIVIAGRYFKPNGYAIKQIYRVGVPSTLLSSVASVMSFCLNSILISFTETATAAFGAYFKLQSFIFMPVFGLNSGVVPIISYNFGAGHKERIFKAMKLGYIYAFVIMLLGTAVMQIFPAQLLSLFEPSEEFLAIGVPALRIISISFIPASFGIVCATVFQALGTSRYSVIVSCSRQLLVLVPLAFALSFLGDVNLVWIAFPAAEAIGIPLSIIFLRKTLKNLDRQLEAKQQRISTEA